jgi:tetratricopeptide (TPR) repeat protein
MFYGSARHPPVRLLEERRRQRSLDSKVNGWATMRSIRLENSRPGLLGCPRWLVIVLALSAVCGIAVWLRSYHATLERVEALQLHERGYFAEAEPKLLRALSGDARDADVLRALALSCCSAGRDEEGEIYLGRWCDVQSDQAEPHRCRMECLQRLGKLQAAAAEGEHALTMQPDNLELRKRIVFLHFKDGRYADVERLCRGLPNGQPRNPELVYFMAEACYGQGKNDEAARLIDPLVSTHPKFVEPRMLRALLHREAGEDGRAIPLLRSVLEADTANKAAHYQLALALARTGQASEAEREKVEYARLEAFDRLMIAIELQPGNLALQLNGAEELLKRGRKADAARVLRRVLAQYPTNKAARKLLEPQ